MTKIEHCYCELLHFGLLSLREALYVKNNEWAKTEIEMLHNIPYLITELNPKCHEYYWYKERITYIDWVNQSASENIQSRLRTYYEPIWSAMETSIINFIQSGIKPSSVSGRFNRGKLCWEGEE